MSERWTLYIENPPQPDARETWKVLGQVLEYEYNASLTLTWKKIRFKTGEVDMFDTPILSHRIVLIVLVRCRNKTSAYSLRTALSTFIRWKRALLSAPDARLVPNIWVESPTEASTPPWALEEPGLEEEMRRYAAFA